MKIAVDMGHCPKSTGSSGYLDELTEDRRIGKALIAELQARGHTVVDVTPADNAAESLSGRAKRANSAGVDFFVSIHLNAGGGTGCEVYTTSSSGAKDEAKKTSAALSEVLGIKNRGHKTANFTVLVKTTMPAMLVETCFVDTKKDYSAYIACTPEKIAAAIAYGIVGGSKNPIKATSAAKVENEPETAPEAATVTLDVLTKGDKGEQVKVAQILLEAKGYDIGSYGVDGSFGKDTESAVIRFQKVMGLTQTAKVDKKTWGKLLGV